MAEALYEWQEECLNHWLDSGARGMVQAVTGSGKTRLALCAIDAIEQKLGQKVMVKIVTPTGALMWQWAKALRKHLAEKRNDGREADDRVGLRGDGRRDPTDRRYMIYVVNSARYELARQILRQIEERKAVFLIADECHHYVSGENRLIFEFLNRIDVKRAAYYSLGLSATLPSGQDGRELAKVLGPCIYTYGMARASALRTICPFDIFHVALNFQGEELQEYEEISNKLRHCWTQLRRGLLHPEKMNPKELFEELRQLSAGKDRRMAKLARNYMNLTYQRKKLVCMAQDRISCADELVRRLYPQDKILIFGERIAQAEELYRILIRRYPGHVGRCHSRMGEQANRNSLDRFRTGEFCILITCKSLDEGVDIPDATAGIVLSGTSAQRQRTQRLGRIIRQQEGKERAALYYLHIEETVEDVCYLPDTGGSRVFELCYDAGKRNFCHSDYDETARLVMEDIQRTGADHRTQMEVTRCLDIGRVRGDWMLEQDAFEQRIRNAAGVEERNYWVCMKRVAGKVQKNKNACC